MSGWLTTIVTRVCLNALRARAARPEQPAGMHMPDPVAVQADDAAPDPEQEALLAESVGLALMVVLDTLTPAERVAFALHDVFGLPFSGRPGRPGDGVDAEEVAMARPGSPASSGGYPECGGSPTTPVVGDPAGYADLRAGGGSRHVAGAEKTPCGG